MVTHLSTKLKRNIKECIITKLLYIKLGNGNNVNIVSNKLDGLYTVRALIQDKIAYQKFAI